MNWFRRCNQLSFWILPVIILAFSESSSAEEINFFTGGGFSDRLLDQVECKHIKRSTPMSAHPVVPSMGATTALDRQFLIQMRMFQCFPTLNYDAERAIQHPNVAAKVAPATIAAALKILSQEVLTKVEKRAERRKIREARRAHRDAVRRARDNGEKMPKYTGPKKTKNKLLTDFTGPFGIRKYFQQLNLVLFEGDKNEYNPGDSAYPWIWPARGMLTIERAATLIKKAGVDIEPLLPNESQEVLKRSKSVRSFGVAPKDQLLKPNSVFFEAPLSVVDPNLSTEQRRQQATAFIYQFYAFYWEFEVAEACAKANKGKPCPEYRAISDIERDMRAVGRDAIALQVTDLRLLRRKSHEALWCQYAKNGGVPCHGFPSQGHIEADERRLVSVCGHLGLPLMTPFTTRIHDSALDPEDLCDLLQRAENAHREWVRGVRHGHTVVGFQHTWTAGIAHGVIRADGALPFDLELETGDASRQGGEFAEQVFTLRDANMSGMTASGECPLGPVENDLPL